MAKLFYFLFLKLKFLFSHLCDLKFFSPNYDEPMLKFDSVQLYDSLSGSEILNNESLVLPSNRISFDAKVRSLSETGRKISMSYEYATGGIQFSLERSDIKLLMSGFFVPTGMFALFSLMSFLISIENVSIKNTHNIRMFVRGCQIYDIFPKRSQCRKFVEINHLACNYQFETP